jgi:Domain of unknown function (DUF5919)
MAGDRTLLAVLLEDRGLARYGTFAAAYQKAARSLDPQPGDDAPSRAQFHRWTTGGLRGLPYTDHCRVLEHMLTGYSAAELLRACPDRAAPGPVGSEELPAPAPAAGPEVSLAGLAGVEAVFASRSEFAASVRTQALLDGAQAVRAAGLSLNMICQQIPDHFLVRVLASGTRLHCLFLDPDGDAVAVREREEEYEPGFLSGLTRFNISILIRLRDRLPDTAQDRLTVAVYDETVRYNILIADDRACVVQPYLPHARGVDSPTLLIRPGAEPGSLYPVFDQVWHSLAERTRVL